jgi:DNA-binding helix-hairpin-helix protein with protein kinase domain
MKTANLVDSAGRAVILGKELGTGGEGSVFEITGNSDMVAKVYHKQTLADQAEKLRAMPAFASEKLRAIAAWPTQALAEHSGGPIVGLTMKKVKDSKEIHTLYSPAQRKATFPYADWKFLIHVAANCAAAFDIIHSHKVVIGDVNQSNIFVNKDGLVNFIDCDSFQIQAAGRTYPCKVGVPLFTPPELIGQSFQNVTRTVNHDRFGLAILVFHLLMMGRHPFSGRFSGMEEMPIERAIQEHRFAYGSRATTNKMQPPLHTLSLLALSPQVRTLFERSFSQESIKGGRPTPAEWFQALTGFRDILRLCSSDSGHQTPSFIGGCVWCELMKQGAPNFFISVAFSTSPAIKSVQAFVLSGVWMRIDTVQWPNLTYTRSNQSINHFPIPWPKTIPSVIPSKPIKPAILTSSHIPPEPVLPPVKFARTVLPYSPIQRVAAYVVMGLFAFLLPCGFVGPVIGQTVFGGPKLSARLVFGIELLLLFSAMLWWFIHELRRRMAQYEKNQFYEAERRERRRLAREQHADWERKLNEAVTKAEKQYREVLQLWEQRVLLIRQEAERRRTAALATRQALINAETAWGNRAIYLQMEFNRKKGELASLRDSHNQIAGSFAVEQQELLARAHEFQLSEFLQQQFIDSALIPDIGPTRKATLASWGIESAYDVKTSDIREIPGFGEKLTSRLKKWCSDLELQFRYNATIGVPEQERRTIEFKYFQLRQPIETKLLDGERELGNIAQRARIEFQRFIQNINKMLEAHERASADLTVIPPGI